MKTLLISLFILLFGCKDKPTPIILNSGDIPFFTVNNIPVVQAMINGKKVYLIIDSGASMSVLDINQERKLKFFSYSIEGEAVGYGGVANFRGVSGAEVYIGDSLKVRTSFRGQDLSNIVNAIKNAEGVYISGILGSDVWADLGAIIDYNQKKLLVTNR